MHRLPDGVFHCPACGSEVLPVEIVPPSASPRTSASRTAAPSARVGEVGSFSKGKGLDPRVGRGGEEEERRCTL